MYLNHEAVYLSQAGRSNTKIPSNDTSATNSNNSDSADIFSQRTMFKTSPHLIQEGLKLGRQTGGDEDLEGGEEGGSGGGGRWQSAQQSSPKRSKVQYEAMLSQMRRWKKSHMRCEPPSRKYKINNFSASWQI